MHHVQNKITLHLYSKLCSGRKCNIKLNIVLLFVACKLSSILLGQLHSLTVLESMCKVNQLPFVFFTNMKVAKLYLSKEHWFLYSSPDLVFKNKLGKQIWWILIAYVKCEKFPVAWRYWIIMMLWSYCNIKLQSKIWNRTRPRVLVQNWHKGS